MKFIPIIAMLLSLHAGLALASPMDSAQAYEPWRFDRRALAEENPEEKVVPDTDKIAHFTVSALATATSIKFFQLLNPPTYRITFANRVLSTMIGVAVGYAKERHDARVKKTVFDDKDMESNLQGVIFGNMIQWDLTDE